MDGSLISYLYFTGLALVALGVLWRVLNRQFDNIDRRLDSIDGRFDAIDRRFDASDRRMDILSASVHTLQGEIKGRRQAELDQLFEKVSKGEKE